MDLRTPSGWYFVLTGLIVTLVGLFSPDRPQLMQDVNVNLYSGLFMIAFGVAMLLLAVRAARKEKRRDA